MANGTWRGQIKEGIGLTRQGGGAVGFGGESESKVRPRSKDNVPI